MTSVARPSTHELRPRKVLMVGPERLERNVLVHDLRAAGFVVHEFALAEQALLGVSTTWPDVAIIDEPLPDMDAFELAARLTCIGGATPATLVLSQDTSAERHKPGGDAPTAVLYKPVATMTLVQEIARSLEAQLQAKQASDVALDSCRAQRFLVIEANRHAQMLIKVLLRKAGFEGVPLDVAGGYSESTTLLGHHAYSHIFVGANPQTGDAIGVLSRLQGARQNSTIVFMLDDNDPELSTALLRQGADDCVVKRELVGSTFRKVIDHAYERKLSRVRLVHAMQHDSITGLPNASLFRRNSARRLSECKSSGQDLALTVLRLENFRSIAEAVGSHAAEVLLRALSERLQEFIPLADLAFLAGDRFAWVSLPSSAQTAAQEAQHVSAALREVFRSRAKGLPTLLRIGIATGGPETPMLDSEGLLVAAEEAADEARRSDMECRSFDSALAACVARRRALEIELCQAIENNEIYLHYQPKINLTSGRISGTEALMRWTRRSGEVVSPGEFVPLLERSGLIAEFGEWALGQACRQVASWQRSGIAAGPVAVNLSTRQFRDADVQRQVLNALQCSGIPASSLQLELTESSLLGDISTCAAIMLGLKSAGVAWALDDFGTGYSSLSYLRHLPFDVVKVDRAFVVGLANDRKAQAIANSIVALGRTLDLHVVGEGIETHEQLRLLKEMGCHSGQGYLLGRPMSPDKIESDKVYDVSGVGRNE